MSVVLAVALLAGNAFFVAAQFALLTARADQVQPLADAGSRAARVTLGQIRHLSRMLTGSQLGIAVCSLGLGAVAEPAFAHLLEAGFDALRLPRGLLHPAAFVIALAFVAYLHMVLGEMVPKNLALAGPARAALLLGPPMAGWVRLTRPLLVAVNGLANAILRLLRVQPKDELATAYTPDELANLFAESAAAGLLDPDHHQRLTRTLTLDRVTARNLAIPLADLLTITDATTGQDLEQLAAGSGYSRYPIRAGADLTGYVHVKDLLELDPHAQDQPVPSRLRRPLITIDANTALTQTVAILQGAGSHLGRVTDGRTTLGAITLEDVLEELVGEIHDTSHPNPTQH
jgi:CBS domain containing-hemolysin-like protein